MTTTTNTSSFFERLSQEFSTESVVPDIKHQDVYLSISDTKISFNEAKHVYMLPESNQKFAISVTGYVKKEIHHSTFDAVAIIRKTKLNEAAEDSLDLHAMRLIEWKYASVFGSLFHAMIEYFFERVINACPHPECRDSTSYNKSQYRDWQMDETNNYFMKHDKLSQCVEPHEKLRQRPVMPCRYPVEMFDKFVTMVLDVDNFGGFLRNNYRFQMANETYVRDIVDTLERAFEGPSAVGLSRAIVEYRKSLLDPQFEVDKILRIGYTTGRYLVDLELHFESFRNILVHLPLQECCDIRPEYIAFSELHGLAGSVDLTMRRRDDPYHILVYDWKTCKSIFTTTWPNGEKSTQLQDYACQLHTYANLMRNLNNNFKIDLFVVNITQNDGCIYNVRNYVHCKCRQVFDEFRMPLLLENKE